MDDLPDDWLCQLMNTIDPPVDEFDLNFPSTGMISVSSMESMEQSGDVQGEMGLNYSSSNENISGLEVSENARTAYRATATRPPLQAQNHVMAERKRRERLNQMLIALSALIPGLKKMDKASVIGDATMYIKQLKKRVERLEVEIKERARGPISTKETSLSGSDEYSAWSDDQLQPKKKIKQLLPEIVVRFSDHNVLVRIHCQKKEGIATRVIRELEKLHLDIMSSSAMPFGSTALEITIITQKSDRKYQLKAKELVETLRAVILKIA